jgi:hypothetical protein
LTANRCREEAKGQNPQASRKDAARFRGANNNEHEQAGKDQERNQPEKPTDEKWYIRRETNIEYITSDI